MGFEWASGKDRRNLAKHGVSFAQAVQIFASPVLERPDPRDHGEPRLVALGHDREREFFVVVYTWRDDMRRIISAWRAGRNDKEAYQKRFGEV